MFWKKHENTVVGIDQAFSGRLEGSTFRYNGRDIYEMERRMSLTILDICRAAGAVCIDGFANLNFGADETYDYVHTNPKGARRIAGFLAPELNAALASRP
jgi:lysophospholipase L1-like esterase